MKKRIGRIVCVGLAVIFLTGGPGPAAADKPMAVKARIIKLNKTSYEVQVTVQHEDTSWEHYADRWEVIGPGGKVLGTRVLYHPHIGERQFTRSLRGLTIPDGTKHVIIRVHDKAHGYGRERLIAMPTEKNRDTGFK
ncbi:MAG: hypothetical protein HOK54_09985 [Alphaproteobacteria bacterium]|nr:hypothetical protein [Alphaproteobacteria bacterium]